jgi:hypothetical protein
LTLDFCDDILIIRVRPKGTEWAFQKSFYFFALAVSVLLALFLFEKGI